MGVVQKKFSRRHKHKLSAEEKLERDLTEAGIGADGNIPF